MTDATPPPPIPNQPPRPLVALADDLRRLTEVMLRVAALPAELSEQVEQLQQDVRALEHRLSPHAPGDRMPRMGAEPAGTRPYYVQGPVIGRHHPLQPIFELQQTDGVTRGRVNFGVTYEGPPGCVHGGFVAFFFDQILGQHNIRAQIPAMTGTLRVRYRRATPLLTDLDFEVRSQRHGERKVVTRGQLSEAGQVVAEAEGLFVVPREDWASLD